MEKYTITFIASFEHENEKGDTVTRNFCGDFNLELGFSNFNRAVRNWNKAFVEFTKSVIENDYFEVELLRYKYVGDKCLGWESWKTNIWDYDGIESTTEDNGKIAMHLNPSTDNENQYFDIILYKNILESFAEIGF